MTRRRMTVKTDDPAEARARAAEAFGVPVEAIALQRAGASGYEASVEPLGFRILPDLMSARVEECRVCEALTPEELSQSLELAEITYGIDKSAVREVCAKLATGESPVGIVVAYGVPPTAPIPGRLEICGRAEYPYFPGMVAVRAKAPVPSGPGWNVRGEEVAPPDIAQRAVAPRPGIGVKLNKTGDEAVATTYGVVRLVGDKASVEPLYEAAPDLLSLKVTLYARDAAGLPITVERIQQALAQDGYVYGFDADAVAAALKDVVASGERAANVTVEAMLGDPPVNGADAKAEPLFNSDMGVGSAVGERLDFRERNSVRNVKLGTELVRVTPATTSVPGKNIRGEDIPGTDGKGPPITPGENIAVSADGTLLTAGMDGMIVIANGVLAVTDCMEIRGDVDFRVGNIRIKKGSVSISGSVRDTFSVDVAGNVLVGDTIEAANIKAGGDVVVAHGIIMREHGSIVSAGKVSALFVENARIDAGGDIVVKNDIINSQIVTRGRVVVTEGRGKIVGGEIRAAHGIEANSIGASGGTGVILCVGVEPVERKNLTSERERLYATIEKIEHVIGAADPLSILKRTPAPKRPAVAKLLKVKFAALQRISQIELRLQEIAVEMRASAHEGVRVLKSIHTGVTIRIAEKELIVASDVSSCMIRYDAAQDRLVLEGLSS